MPPYCNRVRDIVCRTTRSNRGYGMIARYLQFLPLHSTPSLGDQMRQQSGHPLMKLLLETEGVSEGVSEAVSEAVSESEESEDPIVVEVGTYFDIGPNFYDAVFLPQLNAARVPARRVSTSSPLPAGIIEGSSRVSPVGKGGNWDLVRVIPAGHRAADARVVAEFGIPLLVVRLVSARTRRGVTSGETVVAVVVADEASGRWEGDDAIGDADEIGVIGIVVVIIVDIIIIDIVDIDIIDIIIIGIITSIPISTISITPITPISTIPTPIITHHPIIIITPPRERSLASQRQSPHSLRAVSLRLLPLPRTLPPRLSSRSSTRPPSPFLPSNTAFPSMPRSSDSSPYLPAGIIISSPTPPASSATESPSRQPTRM